MALMRVNSVIVVRRLNATKWSTLHYSERVVARESPLNTILFIQCESGVIDF